MLAIRGTEGWVEWLDDAMARLVPFRQVPHAGRVEHGFDKIYNTLRVVKREAGGRVGPTAKAAAVSPTGPAGMANPFAEQLEQLVDTLEEPEVRGEIRLGTMRPRYSFLVTGHSLGAALATLFVIENNKFSISTVYTFASPRVGDAEFVRQFNQLPLNSWRIVNSQDIVPKLPLRIPVLFGYAHVATAFTFSAAGQVKCCPGCWHSISTYLHGLDETISVDGNCKP